MFPKPGQTDPSEKWAYVKKVTLDGTPGMIASGFIPNDRPKRRRMARTVPAARAVRRHRPNFIEVRERTGRKSPGSTASVLAQRRLSSRRT